LNLNVYLFANLVSLCLLVIGLWRGQPTWDTSIRLPNILIFLVIINTILIFREGLLDYRRSKKTTDHNRLENLRKILSGRREIDDKLLSDAFAKVHQIIENSCGSLYMFEEKGFLDLLQSFGSIPSQLSSAKFQIIRDELQIRHPGGLGEEFIVSWNGFIKEIVFRSRVTCLTVVLVPLFLPGNRRGMWAIVTPSGCIPRKTPLQGLAMFLESVLTLSLTRSQSKDVRYLDPSTGLMCHDWFNDSLETEVERSERYNQSMTLMLISVCPFSELSDIQRDSIVKTMATALRESIRRLDLMFGGKSPGNFIAVLTETNMEVSRIVADRILSSFKKHAQAKEALRGLICKIHIGTATYPTDGTHGEGLLEKSGEALVNSQKRDVAVTAYGSMLEGNVTPAS